MLPIPSIRIHQQYAQIGIDADLGSYDMRQPRAAFEMQTTRPQLTIHQEKGELVIDQSKAWDALGTGNILGVLSHIYSEAKGIGLQGISRRVENGNRLAAIHLDTNAIADIVQEEDFQFQEFDYTGPASFDNVDVTYTASKAEIQVEDGTVRIDTHPRPPEVEYHRGKLDIYMLQNAKVEITPPQIDTKI